MSQIILEVRNLEGETPLGKIGKDSPVNFILRESETGVFLGGKEPSQLWRLLLGKGSISNGSIEFGSGIKMDDENIQWRSQIGFVHRDKGLISNLTLLENVLLPANYHGLNSTSIEQVMDDALIKKENWDKRPSEVGWKSRKKTLLARSVILNPKLLILDDPTELYPYTDYHELYTWIEKQKKNARGILIGTENTPFGLAMANWILQPENTNMETEFKIHLNKDWIDSAQHLKKSMIKQVGINL
ncbi:MAG: ATP-binding cassette domain-containing protein [Halobacteriovoraceae bacterium]|nr:ATP-binding cassette domain-containing protein [Halobacteriovoraceae bacterium]MBT5092677.1 ATP-binding cassette domain-containing protein [Halobacteriovoraceae bacterium]